jgi:GT2 family glycosyltransferase
MMIDEKAAGPRCGASGGAEAEAGTPEVSIIVVSYNTRVLTLACLRSVLAETSARFELIVIDNASSDGSAAAIREAFADEPRLRLVEEGENHGFARANNLATAHARGEKLLLLNPDTEVHDGAVDRLLAFAGARPEAGLWGGRTVFADGTLNPTSCWGRPTLWSTLCRTAGLTGIFPRSEVFNPEAYGGWPRDREREVDIVTGCFLLIDRALWDRLGGFDPVFTMYGEEADLCLRARTFGARPRITPTACIVHHGGASETVRADRVARILRGRATVMRRHMRGWKRDAALFIHAIWPLTRWWASTVLGALPGRRSESAAVWREVWLRRAEWARGW